MKIKVSPTTVLYVVFALSIPTFLFYVHCRNNVERAEEILSDLCQSALIDYQFAHTAAQYQDCIDYPARAAAVLKQMPYKTEHAMSMADLLRSIADDTTERLFKLRLRNAANDTNSIEALGLLTRHLNVRAKLACRTGKDPETKDLEAMFTLLFSEGRLEALKKHLNAR